MSVRFCVLGSGSKGNATLLTTPHTHVLIDAGFFPDELARRMDGTGARWETLDAVLLTHTHGDHMKKRCFVFCAEHNVKLYCHERHAAQFAGGRYFKRLAEKNLVCVYDGAPFEIRPVGATDPRHSLRVWPVPLPHDAEPTFGFRVEAFSTSSAQGAAETLVIDEPRAVRIGYIADCGHGRESIIRQLADVDLLALEFNHDVELERRSGRPPMLIERVLSDDGHLSNAQAAEMLQRICKQNGNGGPKVLIQLHLSAECNKPELAYQSAQSVIREVGAQTRIFSSRQDQRGTIHVL